MAAMQLYQEKGRETAASFWRKVLGVDAPDGMIIDGQVIQIRETLMKAMAEIGLPAKARTIKLLPIDLEFIRMAMSWAYGIPGKVQPDKAGQRRMPYIGRHGLPWEWDPMAAQERLAIEAQKDQEKIDAAARQQQLQGAAADSNDDEEDPETPQLVR